ncbi:MAG: alpha/beta fold hydrolase [Pseudonocardia sp.]|nr:alpha/beta fold hydrolase [Pseudonocardia sp.]MBO0876298.1 alpha/beta fold hydrolase [Pseudonocardia sp.]
MITVNYERCGSGSPLVLLHGIGHRWQAWRPVLDRLAERHDVIAVDMPGFGLSPALPPGAVYDVATSMDVLSEAFATLGLDRPHVAGNSLGGLLAVEAASRGLVASATALSPAGFWSARDRVRALATLRALRASALAPGFVTSMILDSPRLRARSLRVLYEHPERIDRLTALGDTAALRGSAAFRPTLRSGRRYAWAGVPPTVPLTIAWGERDRILPPRQAQRAARLLPEAHHVMLPGCGHVPMIDDPALVATTILGTCARAEAVPEPEPESPSHVRPS